CSKSLTGNVVATGWSPLGLLGCCDTASVAQNSAHLPSHETEAPGSQLLRAANLRFPCATVAPPGPSPQYAAAGPSCENTSNRTWVSGSYSPKTRLILDRNGSLRTPSIFSGVKTPRGSRGTASAARVPRSFIVASASVASTTIAQRPTSL